MFRKLEKIVFINLKKAMKHLMMPITIVLYSLGVDTVFFNLAIDLHFLRFFGFFFGSVDNLFGLVVAVGRIVV